MIDLLTTFISSQLENNHILFSLLLFLHFDKPEQGFINADTLISDIEQGSFAIAVLFVATILGIDIPDSYLTDKSKTLRELAKEIKTLPRLTDAEFKEKLNIEKLSMKASIARN
jgi:hypothetical protein